MSVHTYGRWLREQRESVKPRLTQRKLASDAGISHTYLARLEAVGEGGEGPFEPREEKIDAISRALSRYVGRPLVNEARRAIGYRLVDEDESLERSPDLRGNTDIDHIYRIVEQLKGLAREVQSLPDPYKRLVKVAVGDDLHFRHRAEPNEETEQGSSSCRSLAYA
jgi:transcriptional regulator with XRE-family HTH domain